jgi:hypothetical protein
VSAEKRGNVGSRNQHRAGKTGKHEAYLEKPEELK